jgi:hypothetical protein
MNIYYRLSVALSVILASICLTIYMPGSSFMTAKIDPLLVLLIGGGMIVLLLTLSRFNARS